jgi:hypothetical protein
MAAVEVLKLVRVDMKWKPEGKLDSLTPYTR